jgi:hypothetical protein
MAWEIIKHKDGKVMISVTADELRFIIPSEVEELVDDHDENVVPYNEGMEAIDLDKQFSERSVFTFNIDPENITIKELD